MTEQDIEIGVMYVRKYTNNDGDVHWNTVIYTGIRDGLLQWYSTTIVYNPANGTYGGSEGLIAMTANDFLTREYVRVDFDLWQGL